MKVEVYLAVPLEILAGVAASARHESVARTGGSSAHALSTDSWRGHRLSAVHRAAHEILALDVLTQRGVQLKLATRVHLREHLLAGIWISPVLQPPAQRILLA